MATISTLLDIGLFHGMATISTLLDIVCFMATISMVWYGYNIYFIRHWFDGMATISIGLFRHWH